MSEQIERIKELEEKIHRLEDSLDVAYRCTQKYSGFELKIRINNLIVTKHTDLAKKLNLREIKRQSHRIVMI